MRNDYLFRLAAAFAVAIALFALGCESDRSSPRFVLLSASPQSISVNGASVITARVLFSDGRPVVGANLTWSTDFGSLLIRNGTTDSEGRSAASLLGLGSPGVATVKASVVTGEQGQISIRVGLD